MYKVIVHFRSRTVGAMIFNCIKEAKQYHAIIRRQVDVVHTEIWSVYGEPITR